MSVDLKSWLALIDYMAVESIRIKCEMERLDFAPEAVSSFPCY